MDEQKKNSEATMKLDATSSEPHPLGGIPPEVWEKVFLFLDSDPGSLFNCYKTCRTWSRILEEQKTQFLFQLCASSLKRGYLPVPDLLKCRKICKKWQRGVNHACQSLSYVRPDSSIHFGVPPYIWYNQTLGVTLSSATDVQRLLEDITVNRDHRSLFFHKTVKLISRSLTNDDEIQRLFQNFTGFISEHGQLIQTCVYVACGGLPESERQLEHVFRFLPNLHSLAIIKSTTGWENNNMWGLEWLSRQREALPPMPQLRSINVFLDDAPSIANILLISYGHQLESFYCDFRVISSCAYLMGPVPQSAFRNLKELSVFDGFGSSQFLERLLLFDLAHLEKLSLDYVEVGPRRRSLQSILRIVDRFGENLKELRLPNKLFHSESEYFAGENAVFIEEVRQSAKVKLLGVKKLGVNVELVSCSVKARFLKKFPNLKFLRITNYGVTYGDDDKIEKEMKAKVEPFWELIPSLRKISVERAYLPTCDFYRKMQYVTYSNFLEDFVNDYKNIPTK